MKAPIKWLHDFVEISIPTKEYADKMTMSGSKVEAVEDMGKGINHVVVGKILSIEKHPDADKLKVCMVDIGSEKLQIVTGAPNVKEGDIIPLAVVGAVLPGGQTIEASSLRGVESRGMMCSIEELQLTKDYVTDAPENGVYVFSEEVKLGTDIQTAFQLDTVVEFEITSNRPDCLCILGLARETAVTLDVPLTIPKVSVKETSGKNANELLKLNITDFLDCTRYSARLVEDVVIKPSPKWMQHRLAAAGMRPINNIVDITNYVMLEYGQPMHAFDFEKLSGDEVIVRRAKNGEILRTLDSQDRVLNEEMLVIADSEKAVALAGVMGGENTEVTPETKVLLLESAVFNGTMIRKTAKKLNLRSEASSRFEKGLDPRNTEIALNRCAQLVEELGAGKVFRGIVDSDGSIKEQKTILLDAKKINRFLGTDLSVEKMLSILKPLGFTIAPNSVQSVYKDSSELTGTNIPTDSPEHFGMNKAPNTLLLQIPSFRIDIECMEDLAEEVARFYGYNNIPPSLLSGKASMRGKKTEKQQLQSNVSEVLLGCGLTEACTLSFASPKSLDILRLPANHPLRSAVVIENPLGEDFSTMRTTTLPDMLKALSLNNSHQVESAWLFEIAHTYHPDENKNLPTEIKTLSIGMYGANSGFLDLKGVIEQVLIALGIQNTLFEPLKDHPSYHPGRTASLHVIGEDGKSVNVGVLGEVHPEVIIKSEAPKRALIAELDLDLLLSFAETTKMYKSLPKFPASTRDIAAVVVDSITMQQMMDNIKKSAGELLVNVNLFDVYKGDQLAQDKKSMAFSLVFRATDRTLTDEEVNNTMARVFRGLESEIGAEVRK